MRLTINGQQRDFSKPITVGQLLKQFDFMPERVVVELNRKILTLEAHATLLQDGDTLELIQFVGGG